MNIGAVSQGIMDMGSQVGATKESSGAGGFFQDIEKALGALKEDSLTKEQDAIDLSEFSSAVTSLIMSFCADGGNVLDLQDAQIMADKILGSDAMLDLLSYKEVSLNDIFLGNLNGGVLNGNDNLADKIENMDFSQLIDAIKNEISSDIDISKQMNQLIVKVLDEIEAGINQNSESAKLHEANTLFNVVGKMRVEQEAVTNVDGDGVIDIDNAINVIEGAEAFNADDGNSHGSDITKSEVLKGNKTDFVAGKNNQGIAFNNVMSNIQKAEIVLEKPIESANLAGKVLEIMESSITNGKDSLMIKLKPDFLGGIAIKLSVSEHGVVAKIVTDNERTQSMLASQMSNLEVSLKEKGIDVARMEVLYNPLNQDTQREGNKHQGQGKNGSRRTFAIDEIDDDASWQYFNLIGEDEQLADGVYNA